MSAFQNNDIKNKRVFFPSSTVRDTFFQKLYASFGSWKKVSNQFNISRSQLECIRNGNYSLSSSLFIQLLTYLSPVDQSYFKNTIVLKEEGWGRSLAGKTTYSRHKEIFDKGRRIGGLKTKYSFDFHMPLTSELCEFLGAFIGDGFTNKYNSVCITQITGDKILDKVYYNEILHPLLKKINPLSNPIIFESSDALRFNVNSKEFFLLLTERFHFPAGKKCYSVVIPDEIINTNDFCLINSCIRGIFDTDGCVAFDRRAVYKIPYMRIILHMASRRLIQQIHNLLLVQGIASTIAKHDTVIHINGFENCKQFQQIIGFHNPRHLVKLQRSGIIKP